jgi:hopanoid biosynthesis associated glycosyl transferase protein HpnI
MTRSASRENLRGGRRDRNGQQLSFLLLICARGRKLPPRSAEKTKNEFASGKRVPPVSILKPLKGVDPNVWECFCSHCDQDYPRFQLIFGVSEASDPAVEVVRRLQEKYENVAIELVVCDRVLGTNTKVSNLAQMLPSALYDMLVVNDSDIRVPSDYLRAVTCSLGMDASASGSQLPGRSVGLATCLYYGVAAPTLGSRLEALSISTDFVPGVLTAKFLERELRFGLGSTLAFRRGDLQAAGGFEGLVDYLADDYELGRCIAATGKKVELSAAVVETFLPSYNLQQFFSHQLRWARTIRDVRRWGYAGTLLSFGLPWALATVLASRGAAWAWALFAMTFAARLAIGFATAVLVLGDPAFFRNMFLLPLRDLLAPIVWIASFMGNSIRWRGDTFTLKNGKLIRTS